MSLVAAVSRRMIADALAARSFFGFKVSAKCATLGVAFVVPTPTTDTTPSTSGSLRMILLDAVLKRIHLVERHVRSCFGLCGQEARILVRQEAFRDRQIHRDRQHERQRGHNQRQRPEPQHNIKRGPVESGKRG